MSESAENEKKALVAVGAILGAGAVLYGFIKAALDEDGKDTSN